MRLRAILWRRSLRLYESWYLADFSWHSPLKKAMASAFRKHNLDKQERVHRAADVFGETAILTVVHLLALLEDLVGAKPTLFVDLGCGRGTTCLTAACLGVPALGFEQEAEWVRAAERVVESLAVEASFQCGDFMEAVWPSEGAFFVVGTAYSEAMLEEISGRLSTLRPGSVVITGDWSLKSPGFEILWKGKLPVHWGIASFEICCRTSGP